MGIFNPRAPQILGQEWVPIRDEVYVPDIFREDGYQFATRTSNVLTVAKYHTGPELNDIAVSPTPGAGTGEQLVFQSNVYPTGQEVLTGAIQKVTIPVMSGTVSGTAVVLGGTVQDALAGVQGSSILFDIGSGSMDVNFNTTAYSHILSGKRILRINIIADGSSEADAAGNWRFVTTPLGATFNLGVFQNGDNVLIPASEVTPLWSTATTVTSESTELHAWRYPVLARMSTLGATPRIVLRVSYDTADGTFLDYLVMEVYYCEETRVASGAREMTSGLYVPGLIIGANQIILRDSNYSYPTTIAAGQYTMTFNLADFRGSASFVS